MNEDEYLEKWTCTIDNAPLPELAPICDTASGDILGSNKATLAIRLKAGQPEKPALVVKLKVGTKKAKGGSTLLFHSCCSCGILGYHDIFCEGCGGRPMGNPRPEQPSLPRYSEEADDEMEDI
jgi:hypothetical protein